MTVRMFRLTSAAASLLSEVRRRGLVPSSYGTRISSSQTNAGHPGFDITFERVPRPGDVVSEQHGLVVFVAETVAELPSDLVLDVEASGADDGASLAGLVLWDRSGIS
jgi:hypothetical protein